MSKFALCIKNIVMGNNSFIQSKGKGKKMKKALCKRLRKWDAYIRENCIKSEEIYNNYYFISEKIRYAERQIKSAFSKPSYRIKNISEILKRYEYSINESEFYAEIRNIKLTDEELENLYPLLIYCCVYELYTICRGKKRTFTDGKVISFMRRCEFFNYKRFFSSLSNSLFWAIKEPIT